MSNLLLLKARRSGYTLTVEYMLNRRLLTRLRMYRMHNKIQRRHERK